MRREWELIYQKLMPEPDMLAISFAARATGPKDGQQLAKIVAWAVEGRFAVYMLNRVLAGEVLLDWQDGQIVFSEPPRSDA